MPSNEMGDLEGAALPRELLSRELLPRELFGWQLDGWLRPVDIGLAQLLVELGHEKDADVLIASALVSYHLGCGHVCMDLDALLHSPEAFLPNQRGLKHPWRVQIARWQQIGVNALCERLRASDVVGEGEGAEPLVLDKNRLYLRRYWHYETLVASGVRDRMSAPRPIQDLKESLARLFPEATEIPDWQQVAVAMASAHSFAVISGGPGTGKTTTVVRLLSLLQEQAIAKEGGRPLRIALAAPTGKAAARLTESISGTKSKLSNAALIPDQVSTLHRLLGIRTDGGRPRYYRGKLLHVDVLVIDEASMVDLEMMAAVMAALPAKAQLILLGDKDQLASVEAGAILGEICKNAHLARYSEAACGELLQSAGVALTPVSDAIVLDDHIVTLKKSYRFQGAIGALASAMNESNAPKMFEILNSGDSAVQFRNTSQLHKTLAELVLDPASGYALYLRTLQQGCPTGQDMNAWAKTLLEQLSTFQILCALRKGPAGVDAVNEAVVSMLKSHSLISQNTGWYAGRPVMVTRNDYSTGLMNGDVGIALPEPTSENASPESPPVLRVYFAQPDGIRRVLPSRLTQAETVFAMTVHKSQGSEFKHTCLVLPESSGAGLTRELVYTAVTRAKERVTIVGSDAQVLARAIQQRVVRCSGLAERLA
ncbi:ATP-dependent exoDNAse (exonuclease V), alpha-subunit-helicasesuperfamily I member [gamma proteobacterium HdN1]|nr:ATP-dependent exoDNAse (exonuclease V), alpha-subunit-helicasesuperfamily I member [gamma proteobacterium HdN1]